MNGPRRARHAVSTKKILSAATFFVFVQIGNVNSRSPTLCQNILQNFN